MAEKTWQLVNFCEIDKYAVQSYCAIHGVDESLNLGDITQVDETQIDDFNFMTWGFPCGLAGSYIRTNEGFKNIEDIQAGDYVLTHNNRYSPVKETMKRVSNGYYQIYFNGNVPLKITENHPCYVWRNNHIEWIQTKNLVVGDYLSINVNQQEDNIKNLTNIEAWLIGRYVADGYCEHDRDGISFSIGKLKVNEFEEYIKEYSFKSVQRKGCNEYRIKDKRLYQLCCECGDGATNKKIPQFVINLPKDLLKVFLNGYIAGDGFKRKDRNMTMYSTASKQLAFTLEEVIIKLFHKLPTMSLRNDSRKESFNKTYNCQFNEESSRFSFYYKDKVWVKIKRIEEIDSAVEVYNFSVDTDESYTINNIIVHNCQDISIAGKQSGFTDTAGETTRSGLYYDGLRILKAKQPAVSIIENVKNLTGKKFKDIFNQILSDLNEAGYNSYWKVLNSKDYGVPQNRERVFIVSIRKDLDNGLFNFPEPFDNGIRLKDVLEDEVDEKFYVNTPKAQELIDSLIESGKLDKEVSNSVRGGGRASLDRHQWDLVQTKV